MGGSTVSGAPPPPALTPARRLATLAAMNLTSMIIIERAG
jgi:hypothetical protein